MNACFKLEFNDKSMYTIKKTLLIIKDDLTFWQQGYITIILIILKF